MSEDRTFQDTKRQLDDLERRINAAKASVGAPTKFADDAHADWNAMVDSHAEIRRRLDGVKSAPDSLEGIRFDIDILRHAFERWAARVESNFDKDARKAGG